MSITRDYEVMRLGLDGEEEHIATLQTGDVDAAMHQTFSKDCRLKRILLNSNTRIYTDGHTEYHVFCKLRHEPRTCTVWQWSPEAGRVWVADFVSSQIDATMRDRFNARRFPETEKIEGLLHYADVETQTQYLVEVLNGEEQS